MQKTKVFKSGNSMAIRLPKGFQFLNEEVEILKQGEDVIIRNIPKNVGNLEKAYDLLRKFPEDFFKKRSLDREDAPPQEREVL